MIIILKILLYLILFILFNCLVILLIPFKTVVKGGYSEKNPFGSVILYWLYPFFHVRVSYVSELKIRIVVWLLCIPIPRTLDVSAYLDSDKNKIPKKSEEDEAEGTAEKKESIGNEKETSVQKESGIAGLLEKWPGIKRSVAEISEYLPGLKKSIRINMMKLDMDLGIGDPVATAYLATFYYVLKDLFPADEINCRWNYHEKSVTLDTAIKIKMKLGSIFIIFLKYYRKTKKRIKDEDKRNAVNPA